MIITAIENYPNVGVSTGVTNLSVATGKFDEGVVTKVEMWLE